MQKLAETDRNVVWNSEVETKEKIIRTRNEKHWEKMFQLLCQHKERFGHFKLGEKYNTTKELAIWVNTQRKNFKSRILSQKRMDRLNAVEFPWKVLNEWEETFTLLCRYKEIHGDCLVKRSHTKNDKLANWVNIQRREFKNGVLAKERMDALNAIGFVWNVKKETGEEIEIKKWNEMFHRLQQYKKNHGHCNVSRNETNHEQLLNWVKKQRLLFNKGTLSQERIEKLNKIEFIWDVLEYSWQEMFLTLVSYKEKNGTTAVSRKDKPNKKLTNWVMNQRAFFKKGKLPQEKIGQLNSIGFIWMERNTNATNRIINHEDSNTIRNTNTKKLDWEEMFQHLCEYKKNHGNCLIKCYQSETPQLSNWVSKQRVLFKKGALPQEKINRLNSIDFVWDVYEYQWEEMFFHVSEYKRKHGHFTITEEDDFHKKLTTWMILQRICFKEGELMLNKIHRLNGISFVWDPHQLKWEEMFETLKNYQKTHGNCLVPRNYKNKKLLRWINNQRHYFKKGELSRERINQLNSIGFVWNLRKLS